MDRALSLNKNPSSSSPNRLLKALGMVFVGLGAVGIFLPLMPTTIFWIIAVWCFASSAPELKRWIHEHPQFGAGVQNFTEHGVLSSRGKTYALLGMYGGLALSAWLFQMPTAWWAGIGMGLLPVALFLITRPISEASRPMPEAPTDDSKDA
jgi:uncharacterized membrane protein YbaN (DUF454 family)